MTTINNIPDRFLLEVCGNMETNPDYFTEDQKRCICESYDKGLEPEEIASMLDHSNMVIDNETKPY